MSFQPKTGLGFLDAIATKVAATAKLWLGARDGDVNTSDLKTIDLKAMKLLITWSLAAPILVFALAAQLLTIPTAIALALSTSGIFMLSCGIISKQKDIKNAGILAVIGSAIVISVLVSASGQAAMQMAMLYFVIPAEVYLITKQRQSVIAATFASIVLGACAVIIASVGANELAHSTLLGATIILMLLGYGFARVFHNDNASMAKVADQSELAAETTLAPEHAPVNVPVVSHNKLIEDLPGLVTCHDANGDVMSVHGQSPEILSARASNLLGKGFVNQVHVSDRIRFMSAIDKLRQGVKCVCVDLRFETGFHNTASDLQFTHIQANLIGQFNHENDLEKFYIQSIDMTSLHNTKALVEQYQTAERDAEINKTRFLAGVSHELRTPLNSIMGFADVLIHEVIAPLPDERHKEYVSLIRESGEHLLNVVNTMLDMSKIQNGQYTLYSEPFEFSSLLDRTKSMLDIQAGKKKIELNCRTQKGLQEVKADRRAMQQILINLVGNSIKFTEEKGVVTVDADIKGSEFILKVSDTGIGIPADKLSQIGQPFMQVNSSLARQYEGTGLGISLVKGLVELHHGRFDIQSVEGEGTQITITIPQLDELKDETHSNEDAPEIKDLNKAMHDDGQAVYQGGRANVA
ncbi:MAG: HAMP domain-containing sensor histidine kinase [Lentilitoribacter sp.]